MTFASSIPPRVGASGFILWLYSGLPAGGYVLWVGCLVVPQGRGLRDAALRALRGVVLDGQIVTDRLPLPPDGNRLEFHHIVALALPGALPSREIVARYGIGIDDLANAAILPQSFHRGGGLHSDAFVRNVNRYLRSAVQVIDRAVAADGLWAGRVLLLERLRTLGDMLSVQSGSLHAVSWQGCLRSFERVQLR